MKQTSIYFTLLLAVCVPVIAADIHPLMTKTGRLVLTEAFDGDTIPDSFRTLRTPKSFRIVDNALEMISQAGQEHATHGAFMIDAKNVTVAFSMKFIKTGTLYIGIDGYKQEFEGNTHLVRFSFEPNRIAWDQKRGGPDSKHAVSETMKAARKAKQPVPKPTPEQLANPKFFRTEELAAREIETAEGKWHEVLLEVNGNELVAQVDDQAIIATSTEADAMKNRIGFGVTGRGTILIDNVRVWENNQRTDWQKVRSTLTETTNTKS